MLSSKTSRWIGLFLLMLGIRLGYKYYRSQQPTAAQQQMAEALERRDALIQAIKTNQAAQRAAGHTAVVADSTQLATDTTQGPR